MKKQDRVVLQREKLHKEVWQTPVRQLAKKYGMSDVGLAKVCKRMDIPLPPRGYWAKQAHGHKVAPQALPPASKAKAATATLNKSAEELLHIAKSRATGSKVRHQERQRIHRLQQELKDWEMSNRIRAYVSATHSAENTNAERDEFLTWARTYADHLDPTINFRIDALDSA